MKQGVFISVMGTMGSGKTTASRVIAKALGYQLVEENFGENAFLPRFYNDMKRWAFHSQTFFLMEKINQMLESPKLLAKGGVRERPKNGKSITSCILVWWLKKPEGKPTVGLTSTNVRALCRPVLKPIEKPKLIIYS